MPAPRPAPAGRQPIAIVGAGCRFPGGGNTPELFWQQLCDGADVIREVPAERWDVDRLHDERPDVAGTMYARWGGFLDDVDRFDAAFFGIRPQEAQQLDPQQRLLLQVSWEALADAGVAPDQLAGTRTGVFTSALGTDYQLLHTKQAGLAGIDPWYASGKEASFGAGRISYLLGTNGVTLTVSTACSSSLVGTHLACQSLQSGESDLALVGGANVILSPELSMFMCRIGAMSATGRCRVFDASADGVVRGDGCAVIVLKRLADALADRDDVLAVIRGSAVNHDGHSAGLTVPNGAAQQALVRRALEVAGAEPVDIGYVETHGTGTPLGDPIEVESLASVLCADRTQPLLLGSLKANFGHMDAAAGVAGLLKTALVLRHGQVPPQLHLSRPNPNIRWDRWPLSVPTTLHPLPASDRPALAGVSAFGLSGTNAHLVLEQAPVPAPRHADPDDRPAVLAISARTGQALAELASAHLDRLPQLAGADWDDYVASAALRRQHHEQHRIAVVARDADEAAHRLRAALQSRLPTRTARTEADPGPVFVFCGQGSQWLGMGRELLAEAAFAEAFTECEQAIGAVADWSLRAALDDPELLSDTGLAQPVIFALQVSLAALWRSWGVAPAAVLGHSMGEVAAARVAGVLSLVDASRIITHRGRILRCVRGHGLMATVELPVAELTALIERFGGELDVSAVNSPVASVVSGSAPAVRALLDELHRDAVVAKLLPGEYAFHTPALARYAAELRDVLGEITVAAPDVTLLSTTAGADGRFDATHWGRNVSAPVHFGDAAAALIAAGHRAFLELGPHPVLGKPLAQCLDSAGVSGLVVPSLRRNSDSLRTCRTALAAVYAAGYPVDWSTVVAPDARAAKLPGYPWQQRSYWFEGAGSEVEPAAEASAESEPAEHAVPSPGELEQLVTAQISTLLDVDAADVRPDTGFAELGLDSLLNVELRRRLNAVLGLALPVTTVFDHPSVRRLAAHLSDRLADRTVAASSVTPAPSGTRGGDQIAVIGIGCRFPGGAHGPERFWQLLADGTDAITEAPPGRFGGSTLWRGGFLDGVDEFDARFFRIPPREAKVMDPQQRLFLETAWEALEHAGQPPQRLAGSKLSVFVGMNSTDYTQLVTAAGSVDAFFGTGNSFCAVPGRLSHLLGVHGPSLAVDTACSSSLVAIHLACQSLRRGESELAVAGGVNLMLRETIFQASAAGGALAADGRCKTFAASADGYARGEGCGVVVLKPLQAALTDGDPVLAVVLGSAVNQDGPSSGLTVPYGPAQQQVLRAAFEDAGIDASEIGYVEAHGTGTRLGDPIELQALGDALRSSAVSDPTRFLVGSVKTNIGHLEAAAGVAGFIKTVLSLGHGVIPPHLHFDEPSPDIAWDELPLDVPTAVTGWPAGRPRRVAGVSAFGFSGTNAHVVLAAAPEPAPPAAPEPSPGSGRNLLLLSAVADAPLRELAGRYADRLAAGVPSLGDLCHTAATRRARHEHQLGVVGRDAAELAAGLRAHLAGQDSPAVVSGVVRAQRASGPVFVFSGHGSQWPGMAADLLAGEPVFTEAVARCDAALRPHLGWSVSHCLRTGGVTEAETDQQLLVFAIQVGLAALWESYGIRPAAVVGHSMGEVAAAHVAGAISLSDAARLIFHRTRALQGLLGHGGMAVVGLPAAQVETLLAGYGDRLCVAVVNSGRSTVVSGADDAIDELGERLTRDNTFFRRVDAGGPGHSPLAEPLRLQLLADLGRLPAQAGAVPYYSAVTGGRLPGAELDEGYWGHNLRQPVRFAEAVNALLADGYETFIELSAHPLLLVPIEQEARAAGVEALLTPSLVREQDGPTATLTALARLQVGGQPVELARVTPGRHADVPTYPWQRQRYWVEPAADAGWSESAHPLISRQLRELDGGTHYFEGTVTAELFGTDPDGAGAVADDATSIPDGAWLELAVAGVLDGAPGNAPVQLSQVRLPEPLVLSGPARQTVQLAVTADSSGAGFVVRTVDAGNPGTVRVRAEGRIDPSLTTETPPTDAPALDVELPMPPATRRWLLRPDLLEQCLCRAVEVDGSHPGSWRVSAIATLAWRRAPGELTRLRIWRRGEHTVELRVNDAAGEECFALLGIRLERWHGRLLSPAERSTIGRVRYRTAWRDCPLPAAAGADPTGRWLVLPDAGGIAEAVAGQLTSAGADCVVLPAELATATAELRAAVRQGSVRGVVCLSALGLSTGPEDTGPDDTGFAVDAEFFVAVHGLGRVACVPVQYVTRGGVTTGQPQPVSPAQAAVWRLAAVAAVEQPGAWGGLLDLPPTGTDAHADAAAIVTELACTDGEDRVALRDGRRLAARLARMAEPDPVRLPWQARPARTYLVVGTGPTMTDLLRGWLAERGAEHVRIIAPEQLDTPDRVGDLAGQATATGLPIGGVLWAAVDWSLPEPTVLDADAVEAAVRARTAGAWLLHQQCTELDLFVVFTGVAAEWGAAGAAGQAVPDALLAALVSRRRASGLAGCNAQWAAWDDPELLDRDSRSRLVRSGLQPLPGELATDLLDQLVAEQAVDCQFTQADWGLLVPLYQQAGRWPLFTELTDQPDPDADLLQWLAPLPAERQHEELTRLVLAELGVVLGLDSADEVDLEQGFFAMGVTSITGLEFRVRLERRVGISLPATLVFECPTVAAVADFIQREALPGAGVPIGPDPVVPAAPATPGTDEERTAETGSATDDDLLERLEAEIAATSALLARRTR